MRFFAKLADAAKKRNQTPKKQNLLPGEPNIRKPEGVKKLFRVL